MTETQSAWVDDQTWKARWEKINQLDGGGQGEAYRARRRSDGKIGFLKIIKSKKVAERRARFFREAAAYDSFGVDGIPRLIESNAHRHADDSVTPFIVIEFIEGATLRSWRESQASVSIETAVTITSRLLDILKACHAQGCVHRDVKPDNIILKGGSSACVWLLDFGISYHDLTDIDFQTEHWQEVGNRFLRLPELSAGSLSKQDPRSDVCFAAGILFYLLTGDPPDVLQDSEGRLPHQRTAAVTKLQQGVASPRLALLLALFDDAFATRMVNRFATVQAMYERMNRMMQDQPPVSSADENLAALREILDTSANRQLAANINKLGDALTRVQRVFNQVQNSIGGNLSISQTGWVVTGEGGKNTLFWSRQGSNDRIFSVTYESLLAGEELLLRMSGETVYRTDLTEPSYGDNFQAAIQTWLADRLLAALSEPNALPPEADIFREIIPFGSLEAAALEARRSNRVILAFVYDPTQPERGKLRWALGHFLQNQRTRKIMSDTFVTAIVPLSAISAVSDILNQQSMEESRWVVLNQQLRPLEQQVIHANPREAERIVGELAQRY
ncbi:MULTISPECIES: serine/threonine protein kinase [Xanthomonas]|uniref:serine/threonine protein kinase n=1 Tax=Xanthomonas TaxID=338 RepID=UPI001ADC4F44|nr:MULTISPECIES: protein kinase [unclassified Xanthomonas]MBO9873524.1 protein kinase [Xanthomonas sp. D-93]WNH45305.1 protein kinase [Xanthomonas sp. A6251]